MEIEFHGIKGDARGYHQRFVGIRHALSLQACNRRGGWLPNRKTLAEADLLIYLKKEIDSEIDSDTDSESDPPWELL